MPNEELKRTMREIYRLSSEGVGVPEVVVMNGGNLNQILQTDEYDPSEAYYVTKDGITVVER